MARGAHWGAARPAPLPCLCIPGQRHPASPLPLCKPESRPGCLVAGTAAGWARGKPRTAGWLQSCCTQGEKRDPALECGLASPNVEISKRRLVGRLASARLHITTPTTCHLFFEQPPFWWPSAAAPPNFASSQTMMVFSAGNSISSTPENGAKSGLEE
jgi:hypothetical protein